MRVRRALRASLAGAVALLTAACGASATSDSGDPPAALDKTKLKVGMMPIVDTAPFWIAKRQGFFTDAGLSVKAVTIQGGADGIPKLKSQSLDITFGNYVSAFLAHSQGTKLNVVAEGYSAEEGVLLVMSTDPDIREPKDLAKKTIAVNTKKNVGTLTVRSVLESHGVDPESVQFEEVPFPEMAAKLKNGSVDAAWMVEPFISQVKTGLGAHKVLDSASGATEGWPIAGYFTTQKFNEKYPKAVQAFRQALQRGQRVADDRAEVEAVVPSYTKIKPGTIAIMNVGEYPTTIEPKRLQRVVDLMQQFGVLEQDLDVSAMASQ